MTKGQVNIILVLKGLPKWQRKWGEANEKWKRDWVLSDVDWEELRERARPELDEALSVGDKVFFAKVKKGLQVLQPLAEDAKDTSEYKLIKYIEEYVKKFTLVWEDDEPQPEQAVPKPQQEKDEQPQTKNLPNELNTEEALRCFAKAIELGLMSDNYEWKLKTNKSLVYFMGKMSDWLELSNRMDAVCWQPFVELFGGDVRKFSSTYSKMTNGKEPLPKEADLINRVFGG